MITKAEISPEDMEKLETIATRIAESWLDDMDACIGNITDMLINGHTGFKDENLKEVFEEWSEYLDEED